MPLGLTLAELRSSLGNVSLSMYAHGSLHKLWRGRRRGGEEGREEREEREEREGRGRGF